LKKRLDFIGLGWYADFYFVEADAMTTGNGYFGKKLRNAVSFMP